MAVDIFNFVSITTVFTPAGLLTPNTNNIALLTIEKPASIEEATVYVDARSVEKDYGTDSITYKMASAIFSQSPNILTGGGKLMIVPMQSAVSATPSQFETTDISANLPALQDVINGSINITINGNEIPVTGLDFSHATSLKDVTSILQKKISNVIVTGNDSTIIFQTKRFGINTSISLSPNSTGTDISGPTLLNISAGVTTDGTDSSGESLVEAISRARGLGFFAGVITNLDMGEDAILAASDAVQTYNNELIYVQSFSSKEDNRPDGTPDKIRQKNNINTRALLYTTNPLDAKLFSAAALSMQKSVNRNGYRTAKSGNLRKLRNILPDNGINQTEFNFAKDTGIDFYSSNGGEPGYVSNGANRFWDDIESSQYVQFGLQYSGLNTLIRTNTKVAQDEAGMDKIKSALTQFLVTCVSNGIIATGLTWNSSETFGDEELFRSNIKDQGFYMYSQPIESQSQSDREQRKAPLIQIAFKLAGAIHKLDIILLIEQ